MKEKNSEQKLPITKNINLVMDSEEKLHIEEKEIVKNLQETFKGKTYEEIPQKTSRLCGLCSFSNLIASLSAIENAFKIKVSKQTKSLRELILLGSTIKSHIFDLYFKMLPTLTEDEDIFESGKKNKKEVEKAFKLQKLGNEIVELLSGRKIHGMTLVVGGFSKLPTEEMLKALLKKLSEIKQEAITCAKYFSKLKIPKLEIKTIFLALEKQNDYPLLEGKLGSLRCQLEKTKENEKFVKSLLKQGSLNLEELKKNSYLVGSLARINLNYKRLTFNARKCLKIKPPLVNPYHLALAKSIEIVYCIERAAKIIEGLKIKEEELPKIKVRAGEGFSVIESPQGLLFHKYKFDKKGKALKVEILNPTEQN